MSEKEISSTQKETENKNLQKEEGKKLTKEEKYYSLWDSIFKVLLVVTFILAILLIKNVVSFRKKLIERNTEYRFPQVSDFLICIPLVLINIVLKLTLESAFCHITPYIMAKKYREPANETMAELAKIYKYKLASHIYKCLYYFSLTVFAYIVLKPLDYFPKTLLGNGSMEKMFTPGYPKSFYHEKTPGFDLHYLVCLSYSITDLFWLLFIYKRQNDFVNMLLHHVCTILLTVFSYITNYSHAGALVLIIHNESDVFMHITRLLIQTDVPEIVKDVSGVILMVNMIYVRLGVLGQLIYTAFTKITWEWGWTTTSMVLFLCFLYVMHIYWVSLLLYKFYLIIIGDKISDTVNYNKTLKNAGFNVNDIGKENEEEKKKEKKDK